MGENNGLPIARFLRALAEDCDNTDGWEDAAPTVREAADHIEALVEALKGLILYAEAVRMTAGMGKNQLARLEAAKSTLARVRGESGR